MNLPIFAPLLRKEFWSRGSFRNPDSFQSAGKRSSGTAWDASHDNGREHYAMRGTGAEDTVIHVDTTYEVRIQSGRHDKEMGHMNNSASDPELVPSALQLEHVSGQ